MSQCWLCNGPIDQLTIDNRDKKLKPCLVCLSAIQENYDMISKAKRRKNVKKEDVLLDESFDEYEISNLVDITPEVLYSQEEMDNWE